jgi:hypothetical protein
VVEQIGPSTIILGFTLTAFLALPRLGIYFIEEIATNQFALWSLGGHGSCCRSHDGLDD